MEDLLHSFLQTSDVPSAVKILSLCKAHQIYHIGYLLSSYFREIFPSSVEMITEMGFFEMNLGNVEKAFDTVDSISKYTDLWKVQVGMLPHLENRYIFYNRDVVQSIMKRKPKPFPLVTFTITTCKRYDLFEKTMNSFLNCCLDIDRIDRWLCVDDNSSEEDRNKMRNNYPFFEFYLKNKSEKGHPRSMNIIRQRVTTPYLFHLEDDWKFIRKAKYISDCLYPVSQNLNVGQCLVNKNYAELFTDNDIVGGTVVLCPLDQIYVIHQHCATKEEYDAFNKVNENKKNCAYWPHFSFRPSLLKKSVLTRLGEFDEKVSHFEMEYSWRYKKAGLMSTFLPGVYCIHTGRLTSQRDDASKLNAYTLNDEKQFSGKEVSGTGKEVSGTGKEVSGTGKELTFPTYVVNLDRRPDRMEKLRLPITYTRVPAVDGERLIPTERLQRIFEGNDYNMRAGMVGCALSHISLWIKLLYSEDALYCVLEDDIQTVPFFQDKVIHILRILDPNWDLCFLGHHLWEKYKNSEVYDKEKLPTLEKWDTATSLKFSMGGTGGYLISKKGARNLLEFINKVGLTNGIDTMIQKAGDNINLYYCRPHLIYSECWSKDKKVDTDIQNTFLSLTIPVEERIENEKKLYSDLVETADEEVAIKHLQDKKGSLLYRGKNIKLLQSLTLLPNYIIGDSLFIIPSLGDLERLKKKDRFDISDVLVYKGGCPTLERTTPEPTQTNSRDAHGNSRDARSSRHVRCISLGEMTYVDEYLKQYSKDHTEYPFDKIDRCSFETASYLTEMCLSMNDKDLEEFVVEFCSPEKNFTYTQSYNNKTVVENRNYRVVFPHDDPATIVKTYLDRFRNLRDAIKSSDKVLLVHACRFYTDYSADLQHLSEILQRYNPSAIILTINGTKTSLDGVKIASVDFPERFRNLDWTPEKTHFDKVSFNPGLEDPIRNFLEKSL